MMMSKKMAWWIFAVKLIASASRAQFAASEWLSFGYDAERSGWNAAETSLTSQYFGRLKLLWGTQLPTPPLGFP